MQPLLYGYLPILVFLVIAGGIAIAMLGGSLLAAHQKPYAEKLSAGADSVLASLSPRDFDVGMKALRAHAAHSGRELVFEPIDVFVFRSA